jgi:two-component system OmpR family sensor kinase
MGILVDDLLLLARLDQGRPLEKTPVDLAAIATDATADAEVISPNRPMSIDAPTPVLVIGDEQRLRQIVTNLVNNALVHTDESIPIEVRVFAQGDRAFLIVRDEGPGVSEEHIARIFERFYRADPSRTRESGGSGLGLAIVASIAEAHGGSARVETSLGHGATFIVEFPLADERALDDASYGSPPTLGEPLSDAGRHIGDEVRQQIAPGSDASIAESRHVSSET